MHPKRSGQLPRFWGAILVAASTAGLAYSQQPIPMAQQPPAMPEKAQDLKKIPEVQIDRNTGTLLVPLNGVATWSPPGFTKLTTLEGVQISPEGVISLEEKNRNDPTTYLIKGLTTGSAQITFYFKGQPKRVFDVLVSPDYSLLRTIIKRTLPTSAVDVQAGLNRMIILSGYVTSPQDADTVMRLATAAAGSAANVINAVQVGGVQEVQIDVVVASVDRTMARFRGLDFLVAGQTVDFASIVSGLITPGVAAAAGAAAVPPTVTSAANLQLTVVPANFFLALQALRTEGIAKFLAEPKVVTQTGRPAFFRAGGQQAVLSGTSGITGPGVNLVPFGTELEVLPIVYGDGKIWLEINPRITAVSAALGITVGGATSPGFTEQQVKAAVTLESGQTYAIAGLVQNTVQATANKVPVLGDLPFLGVFFSSVTHTQTETELVILVTPRLVAPMNCDQVPKRVPGMETRNPDDYELFLENILEAPRGQRKVWNGHCYNAAYKCDPTAAIFPCVGGVCTGRAGPGMTPVPPVPGVRPVPVAMPPALPPATGPAGPATLPPVPPIPSGPESSSSYPVIPGSPVHPVGTIEPATSQGGLPPVVILPDVPRN